MAIFLLTKSFRLVPGFGFCAPWGPVVAVIIMRLPVESATFLAVQDSSIGDLVTESVSQSVRDF